jgi:geranylgeranyl diphosphate synthase type II
LRFVKVSSSTWNLKQETMFSREYIEMIRLKTAVLLACSLKLGAIIGGASEKDASLLYDFGIQIGLAFQLQDDLLDVYGNPETFGKNIGGDILCNKKTFLLTNAYKLANTNQLDELNRWMNSREFIARKNFSHYPLYDKMGIRKLTEEKIQDFFAKGWKHLNR